MLDFPHAKPNAKSIKRQKHSFELTGANRSATAPISSSNHILNKNIGRQKGWPKKFNNLQKLTLKTHQQFELPS